MTLSNLYYYFGGKNGLLLAILEHSSQSFISKLQEVVAMDLDPLERFERLISTHLDVLEDHAREVRIFFLDEEHLSPEGIAIHRKFQQDILNLYRDELHKLKLAGHVNHDNLTLLALNILGVLNWHMRWYKPGKALTLNQVKEHAVMFILNGVLGPPGRH